MSETRPVKVTILGKEFRIACQDGEQEELMVAASLLEEKMRHIRTHSQISSLDTIAVMAALNIAHELTQAQRHALSQDPQELTEQVIAMRERIDAALVAATPSD